MPAKKNALMVGRVECPECGAGAAVYQNINSALYVRCPECGCDQRNGVKVQTRLWYTMEPVEGVDACRPVNVPDERPDWLSTAVQAEKEQEQVKPSKPKPVGVVVVAALMVGGLARLIMG